MDIDSIIDKIKKAVRLANRTTSAGERETAMRLARNLAERHGVSFDEVVEKSAVQEDRAVVDTSDNYSTISGSEHGLACFIIHTHFGVVMMKWKGERAWSAKMVWIGSRLNIGVARYVYHILIRESRRAWREASKKGVKDRFSFMRGFYFAIHEKLTRSPLRNDLESSRKCAEAKALSFIDDLKKKGIETASSKAPKQASDAGSITMGFTAGNSVNLSRPCEGTAERTAEVAYVPQLTA